MRKTLRFTAQRADIWQGFGQPAEIAESHRVLGDWCARVGRDPGEIERSARVFRQGPDEVGEGLLDVGTRLFQLVSPRTGLRHRPVLDRPAFRDDVNRSASRTAACPRPAPVRGSQRVPQALPRSVDGPDDATCPRRHGCRMSIRSPGGPVCPCRTKEMSCPAQVMLSHVPASVPGGTNLRVPPVRTTYEGTSTLGATG